MLANPKRTKDEIVQWIREYFAENGNDCCAVIGISGGKDSSVVAALCVEALGAERVIGVLMPNGLQKEIAQTPGCWSIRLALQVLQLTLAAHTARWLM